jgi:ribosomal protein S13
MLARIKRLARSRYLNNQSMIKQWISERLEAEFRVRDQRPETTARRPEVRRSLIVEEKT